MKKLAIIWFLLLSPAVRAQLFPLSDFYLFNGLVINPAYSGSQDALSTSLQYRNQWTGFKDAPQNGIFSAHAPFFKDQMGLGVLLTRNSFGIYNETSIMGNYAYRFNLYKGKLSLGLAFGITSYNIAWKDLQATDPDDILLADNPVKNIVPDFSIGTYYTTNNYFIGLSLPFFLTHEPDDNTGKLRTRNVTDAYNYFITGGYSFKISHTLKIHPSVLVRYIKNSKLQGDIYLLADIRDRIKLGGGYRTTDMFIGMLSCNINRQLSVSYSFDTDSGKAGSYRRGSHEIMIGYLFRYARNVMSPSEI